MFKLPGALVALHAARAVFRGEVGAKSGICWRRVNRSESPQYFWIVVGCYALLSVALLTVF